MSEHEKCTVCKKLYHSSCDYNQGRCTHHPPLINTKKFEMNIQPKDTSQGHFWASIIKSITRLGACVALFAADYQIAAIMFFVAEIIGIAEEII